MKTSVKVCLIVAASLILAGGILFVAVMSAMNWNFRDLSTTKYETNTYEIGENFDHISVDTTTADIVFCVSDDETGRVVCYEETEAKHRVEALDGTLTVREESTKKWYDHISVFSVGHPTVTVYLPKTEYASLSVNVSTGDVAIPTELCFDNIDISGTTGDISCGASVTERLTVKTTTGHISVRNVTVGAMDLRVSTGDVKVFDVTCTGDVRVCVSTGKAFLTNVTCENLYSEGDTGDLHLSRVVATGRFSIERDTGDVELDCCDASEIFISTSTGEVEGTLLSEKVFVTKTDTGDVEVPRTTSGGICEITTDTGDIEIEIVR